jgi:hypothetical protein
MLTKNFQRLATEVQRHVEADLVVQGSYATCFIGCLARGLNAPEFLEREYGIPLAVSRIAESIFEGLPPDEAPLFFAAFPRAVESDGKDLSRVSWEFLAEELRLLPPVTPEIQAVINRVVDGLDLLAQGKVLSEEDAKAAAKAVDAWLAESFAELAARAVADAARAAELAAKAANWDYLAAESFAELAVNAAELAARAVAEAANSAAMATDELAARARAAAISFDARPHQRDLLLKLIKEAPVTQQETNV